MDRACWRGPAAWHASPLMPGRNLNIRRPRMDARRAAFAESFDAISVATLGGQAKSLRFLRKRISALGKETEDARAFAPCDRQGEKD